MNKLEAKKGREIKNCRGFTLVELLIIVVVLAFFAALLLPTLRRAKAAAQVNKCLDNLNQLMVAARMYADDSRGLWMYNQPGEEDWVSVEMDWGSTHYNGGAVCTNQQYLVTPFAINTTLGSTFVPYIKDPSTYRCPADPSNVGGVPRVRSYSANLAVGTIASSQGGGALANTPVTGQWLSGSDNNSQTFGQCYQKTSQMIHPSPANLFIFCQEHPNSINDSTLFVQIAEHTAGGEWIDVPDNVHGGAGAFSFADGHAETHAWQGKIMKGGRYVQGAINQGDNLSSAFPNLTATAPADLADLNWVQARTSYPVSPVNAQGFPKP